MTPTERRALLLWRLSRGERFTTRQCADILGADCRAAYRFLVLVSRVVPIFYDDPEDDVDCRWQATR